MRVIDAFVDSLDMEEQGIEVSVASTGRPRYDPKDQLKLYIYGYFNRIRSSRRLEIETHRNIELMWLMRKLTPDHKTIARFRKDNAEGLKKVFRAFVKLCQMLGLYGNELLAIDGAKFTAVNSLENNFNEKKLEERLRRIDEKLAGYLSELNENDECEQDAPRHTKEEIAAAIAKLAERKQKYEGMKSQLEESGETQISTTDPESKRMKLANGGSDVCYNVQTAVDSKYNLIVDYEVTNQCNDKNQLASMAKSAKEVLGVEEIATVADTGFFVASDIAECMANGIDAHVSSEHESITMCIAVEEEEAREAKEFGNQGKNVFIRERNIGLCPMGNVLYPRSYRSSIKSAIYANPEACRACSHRGKCREYDRELKIKMALSEFTREYNDQGLYIRQLTYAPNKALLRRRKEIVEHPFGTIKRQMDSEYFLLKGMAKVSGEFALTCLAYNLKRAINILGVSNLLEGMRMVQTMVA